MSVICEQNLSCLKCLVRGCAYYLRSEICGVTQRWYEEPVARSPQWEDCPVEIDPTTTDSPKTIEMKKVALYIILAWIVTFLVLIIVVNIAWYIYRKKRNNNVQERELYDAASRPLKCF